MPKEAESKLKLWKRLASNTLLNNARLPVVEDVVELPNGTRSTYTRLKEGQPDSVALVVINEADKVLIQKEYSYPPNKIMWQLPGGAVNVGEDLLVASNRELAEESGFQARQCKIIGSFYTNNRRSDQRQYIVLCHDVFPYKLAHDPDEFIENYWLSKAEIKQKITNGEFDNINLLAALNIWLHLPKN